MGRERVALLGLLLVMGTGWGSTQALAKMATATGHGTFGLIFWQCAICAVVLGPPTLLRGKGIPVRADALRFAVVIALIGTILPSFTFYNAVIHLPAGVMSIIISTVPMMAFVIGLLLGMDRFQGARLAGLALGLAGVAIIAGSGGAVTGDVPAVWLAIALIAPLFYALEATYVARFGTAGVDPVQAMFAASVVGMVLSLPVALATGQWFNLLAVDWGRAEWALTISSAIHAVIYAAYVWLAARAGAVFAAQVSYLVTATGVFWAMLLLGERFSPWVWLALVVMLSGVALVQPRGRVEAPARA
jgi:drug/metabolite transporter (DMT)-like permease